MITHPTASHEFAFSYHLPAGHRFVPGVDGSVVVLSGARPVGVIETPWAVDAAGHRVSTHFSIHQHTLLQQVDFTAANRFPVQADPWWNPFSWNWSRIGHVTLDRLARCGVAVHGHTLGRNPVVTLARDGSGRRLISVHGSPFSLVRRAVANCLTAALG